MDAASGSGLGFSKVAQAVAGPLPPGEPSALGVGMDGHPQTLSRWSFTICSGNLFSKDFVRE